MAGKNMYRLLVAAIAGIVLLQTGCSTMTQTEKGVLAGGAIGSVGGALLGHATGNPKTGAVLGGIGGAVVGGLMGNESDQKLAAQADRQYAVEQPQRLEEIVAMAKEGQSERVILSHIRTHNMRFTLSVADLSYLKQNGVPEGVILEMQGGGSAVSVSPPRTRVVREEVIVREPVYVHPPYYAPPPPVVYLPPPRPVVGASFTYRR